VDSLFEVKDQKIIFSRSVYDELLNYFNPRIVKTYMWCQEKTLTQEEFCNSTYEDSPAQLINCM